MTESDLRDAREAVDERIETQRGRRRTWAAVAAAAVAIPVLGVAAAVTMDDQEGSAPPASPSTDSADTWLEGRPPTPELLEGLWRVDNGTLLVRFTSSGAVTFDDSGRLYGDPAVTGIYEIEGDLITVTADVGAVGCSGQTFSMRASMPETGALRFVHQQEPGTGSCFASEGRLWALEQVLPSSEAVTGLTPPGARAEWARPADEPTLHGVWMAVGGGHVVELDPGGVYYVADDTGEWIEAGTWSLERDTLRFTVATAGDGCRAGDEVALGGVGHIAEPPTQFLRAASVDSTCDAAWAGDSWIFLPQERS